jgi:hypothetical protein
MTRIRTHIALLLIAVLTLTGHSMAIARGMPGAAGYMELCTGTGPVMVAVDSQGEPTGAAHICPEFSLMLMEMVATPPVLAVPITLRTESISVSEFTYGDFVTVIRATARAPPAVI